MSTFNIQNWRQLAESEYWDSKGERLLIMVPLSREAKVTVPETRRDSRDRGGGRCCQVRDTLLRIDGTGVTLVQGGCVEHDLSCTESS